MGWKVWSERRDTYLYADLPIEKGGASLAVPIDHLRKGDVVEIPIEEFERLEATLELLQDEDLKEGILAGIDEYHEGRTRPWSEVRDEL